MKTFCNKSKPKVTVFALGFLVVVRYESPSMVLFELINGCHIYEFYTVQKVLLIRLEVYKISLISVFVGNI